MNGGTGCARIVAVAASCLAAARPQDLPSGPREMALALEAFQASGAGVLVPDPQAILTNSAGFAAFAALAAGLDPLAAPSGPVFPDPRLCALAAAPPRFRERLAGLSHSLCSSTESETPAGAVVRVSRSFDPLSSVFVETTERDGFAPRVRRVKYGRTVEESDESGVVRKYFFDTYGNVSFFRETSSDGHEYWRDYQSRNGRGDVDEHGYVLSRSPLSRFRLQSAVRSFSACDSRGNRVAETNALGGVSTFAFDGAGRLVEVSGSAAVPVRYGYDALGRRTSLSTTRDGSSWDETRWNYDAATGLCTNKTFADGTSARFAYTPDGKPLRTTRASGAWTENAYDASGRLAAVSTSDGTSGYSLSHDPFGRVSAVADPGAPFGQTFARDCRGFATNETWKPRRPSYHSPRTLERSFDPNGRLATWRFGTPESPSGAPALSFGAAVSFGPDGNVSAVVCTNGAGRILEAEYGYVDGRFASLDVSTDAGGASFDVERDPYRPQRMTAATVPASRRTIHGTAWTYDALDRPTARTRKMPSETAVSTNFFAYDARGQVTGAVSPESGTSYAYDSIGNRVSSFDAFGPRSYAANEVNAYVSVSNAASASAEEPEWDEDGNLVSFGKSAFGWDSRGRLVSVETVTPEGQPLEIYLAYDWRDRLVDKLVRRQTGRLSWEEETRDYVWDDGLLLLSRNRRGMECHGRRIFISPSGHDDGFSLNLALAKPAPV